MRSALLLSAFVALGLSWGTPTSSPFVVHETRARWSPAWKRTTTLAARQLESSTPLLLPMRFGLRQQNLHTISDSLLAVSDPGSLSYGQHWSPQKVVDHFSPSEESIESVLAWLKSSGFEEHRLKLSLGRGWIDVNATVAEAEELLQTEYHVYEHDSGKMSFACDSYSLPAHVHEHIDIVTPTVNFGMVHRPSGLENVLKKRSRNAGTNIGMPGASGPKTNGAKVTPQLSLDTCDSAIIPDCLRALYSIDHTPVSTDVNTFGILEFTPQAFLADDLDLFFANFSPTQLGTRPDLISVDGGTAQTADQSFNFNGESDLDLQYAFALTDPQPILLIQTGDLVEGASFNNWLDAVDASYCTFEGGDDPNFDGIYPDRMRGGFKGPESCGIIAPPNTVSVSYGADEADFTVAYSVRQCNEYAKLGLLGTSVFYSSGDDGVAGQGGDCLTANGSESASGTRFNPTFPSVCPYITSVGATQVSPNNTVNDPEIACEQVIFSGGGFSNVFEIPSYQQAAVAGFLNDHPPPFTSAQFNNSGTSRAYPDVSANGANYVVAVDGEFELVFGTSCSSPVFASIITLVNDARIAAGKSTVGFINPAVYSDTFAAAFHDITAGGNQGCGTPGFTATTGWDPVTGLGTPNATVLIDLFLALP